METAAVRKTVEDALAAHLQTSTSLSGQQIASLAHETSKEFQAALSEQRRLEHCLKEQREETVKLQHSLLQLQESRVTDAQAMEQNRAVAQATTSGRIDDLQASIQQQRIFDNQRSTNLQAELHSAADNSNRRRARS